MLRPLSSILCPAGKKLFDTYKHSSQPFFINNPKSALQQMDMWKKYMTGITPFYAVKCNPDKTLLHTLSSKGSHFDCASQTEIENVLSIGVPPSHIVFANPIKSFSDLQFASEVGVHKMTFDNTEELYKIKRYAPAAECILRIQPDDSGSLMRFSTKFGAPVEHIPECLRVCKTLQLRIIGTSFHIGSGCFDHSTFRSAIALSRNVWDTATCLGLERFTLLDLGGGFPGNGRVQHFVEFASTIGSALDEYFPDKHKLTIIAEPGRFMATRYSTLFVKIQGKRKETDGSIKYYINDGLYGSFNNIVFDHAKPIPIPIHLGEDDTVSTNVFRSTIFGPTCDSMDCILKEVYLPERNVDDFFAFTDFGAYTSAAGSTFNGMKQPFHVYL